MEQDLSGNNLLSLGSEVIAASTCYCHIGAGLDDGMEPDSGSLACVTNLRLPHLLNGIYSGSSPSLSLDGK